jgi:hypothetical protein
MSWNPFKKKEKYSLPITQEAVPRTNVAMKPMNYSSMVILAWAKAIEGDEKLQDWLNLNGYRELYAAVLAIYLQDKPRDWLMENGYPHLMAMINAAEGNKAAGHWLLQNNFETLYHIAKAVDHEDESWLWLQKHGSQDIFILAKSIQIIKDKIEENHNDPHWINRDF